MAKLTVGAIIVALTFGVTGCGKKEAPPPASAPAPQPQVQAPSPATAAVTVVNVSLTKAPGSDKKATTVTDTFAKGDTIYAIVETTGSGNATLKAKWTYQKGDQTAPVNESSQTISANGPAATEFHISKPDGWPTGDYRVEISLNDKSVGTKTFTVK